MSDKTAQKTSLTGVKPTHVPHLGNFIGAIQPAIDLTKTYRSIYFVADYHALTSVHEPDKLRSYVYDVAASWLASGLDPKDTIVFRQSDVREVFELTWILGCSTGTGQLERGHAYKDAIAKGLSPNAGVFNYPLLMAADILLYDTNVVPVGKDQQQHLEVTIDIAQRVNHAFGESTLVVPELLMRHAEVIPGLDGRKMSKSYQNTIPIFGSSAELKKAVMLVKTGSESLEEPKDPEGSLVFQIFRACATESETATLAEKLRAGNYGWGHAKLALFEVLDARFKDIRTRYAELRADEAAVDAILRDGAERAHSIAQKTMERVRYAVGIRR